jgi:hypothetical protein
MQQRQNLGTFFAPVDVLSDKDDPPFPVFSFDSCQQAFRKVNQQVTAAMDVAYDIEIRFWAGLRKYCSPFLQGRLCGSQILSQARYHFDAMHSFCPLGKISDLTSW